MAWSRGTTKGARAAHSRYTLRRGLYPDDKMRHYTVLDREGITIGPMPRKTVEKQQQTVRNRKMKVTLPTIKEP